MERVEIIGQLIQERSIAIDPNTGHVTQKEAWERIDGLLDALHETTILAQLVDVAQM